MKRNTAKNTKYNSFNEKHFRRRLLICPLQTNLVLISCHSKANCFKCLTWRSTKAPIISLIIHCFSCCYSPLLSRHCSLSYRRSLVVFSSFFGNSLVGFTIKGRVGHGQTGSSEKM